MILKIYIFFYAFIYNVYIFIMFFLFVRYINKMYILSIFIDLLTKYPFLKFLNLLFKLKLLSTNICFFFYQKNLCHIFITLLIWKKSQLFDTNLYNFIIRIEIYLLKRYYASYIWWKINDRVVCNLKQNFPSEICSIDHYRKK